MRRKSTDGYAIGVARLGYVPARSRASLGVELLPDPVVAPLVREAFAMAAAGKSVRQVAEWMREREAKGKKQKATGAIL